MTIYLRGALQTVREMSTKYKFRGLPCNIRPDDQLWCVVGRHETPKGSGGGVLEWCYDEDDAYRVMTEMSKYPSFSGLKAKKYKEE
jgi:hypothetical protein